MKWPDEGAPQEGDGIHRVRKWIKDAHGRPLGVVHISLNQRVSIDRAGAHTLCDNLANATRASLEREGRINAD